MVEHTVFTGFPVSNSATQVKNSTPSPFFQGSSAPQTVIECPRCQTKFSVETAGIAAIENPRFHCSRCDALFSLPEEVAPLIEAKSEPTPKAAPAPMQPARKEREREITPPTSKVTPPTVIEEKPLSPDDFSFGHSTNVTTFPTPKQRELPLQVRPLPDATSAKRPTPSVLPTLPSQERLKAGLQLKPRLSSPQANATRWQGFMILAAAPTLSFVFLLFISFVARTYPGFGNALALGIPGIPSLNPKEVPPPSLMIKSARFDTLPLADGSKVPAVIGRVTNASNQSFSAVQIEALSFDPRGEVLGSTTIPLRLISDRNKITGLDTQQLKELLTKTPPKGAVRPGDELTFVVPLLDQGTRRYFSARVYSVVP